MEHRRPCVRGRVLRVGTTVSTASHPRAARAPATTLELVYTGVLTLLLALASGLFGWQRKNGSCPIGVKRTVGIAGALGGVALLCPVCLALPGLLLGVGTLITILGQFLPLIRLLAIVFALVAVWLLWPRATAAPTKGRG
jgi:hypothetical protein